MAGSVTAVGQNSPLQQAQHLSSLFGSKPHLDLHSCYKRTFQVDKEKRELHFKPVLWELALTPAEVISSHLFLRHWWHLSHGRSVRQHAYSAGSRHCPQVAQQTPRVGCLYQWSPYKNGMMSFGSQVCRKAFCLTNFLKVAIIRNMFIHFWSLHIWVTTPREHCPYSEAHLEQHIESWHI